VSADGSTIAAGAIGLGSAGIGDLKGSISIYTRPAGGWASSSIPIATLTNAAVHAEAEFGLDVALSADGSTLVAGAYSISAGASVYIRPAGGWATTDAPTATLTNPADAVGREVHVSADGSTIVTNGRLSSHVASVYTRPAGGWASTSAPTAMLSVNNGVHTDDLEGGLALSADGSTIVGGAHASADPGTSYPNAAYVFMRPAGGWTSTSVPAATLTTTGRGVLPFGQQLALSADGSTLVAGVVDTGIGYVYTRPAGGWVGTSAPAATITPATSPFGSTYGYVAMSADGSTLIASWLPYSALPGPVNSYTRPAGGWVGSNAPSAEFADADKFQLGNVVALSADGNTLAAGSQSHASGRGAVYLFTKPAGGWATTDLPTARLTNAAGAKEDYLGYAVAMSADGSTLVAGAPQNSGGGTWRGAAYIYTRPAGGWATTDLPTATITYAAGVDYNALGGVVALSADGSTLVLRGEDGGGTARGALYVYTRPAGGWASTGAPAATLTKGLGTDGERLGYIALSADGSTLVVGAPSKDINQNPDTTYPGAAYVYTRPAGGWATTDLPTATLTNAAGAPGDALGWGVALSADGSTIVAARYATGGAAYVYTRPAGGWATTDAPIATLTNTAGAVGDWFGWALALNADGSTLVAAAPYAAAGGTARGALYSYTKPAGSWATTDAPTATFTATPGLDANRLGWAVALSADGRTLVGSTAPAAGGYPAYYGGIYIFRDRTTNATLSGLALSQGTLSPAFATGVRAYTATVAYNVGSITVTPTLADADATVTVNGIPVNSGSASGAIGLRPGPNLITVVVTAEDPAIRTTTTITVTRPARVWLPIIVH